jgi:hypothetical protein
VASTDDQQKSIQSNSLVWKRDDLIRFRVKLTE